MPEKPTPSKPRALKVSIAVTPAILAAAKKAAERRGVSTSRLVRDALLRYPAVKRELVA